MKEAVAGKWIRENWAVKVEFVRRVYKLMAGESADERILELGDNKTREKMTIRDSSDPITETETNAWVLCRNKSDEVTVTTRNFDSVLKRISTEKHMLLWDW